MFVPYDRGEWLGSRMCVYLSVHLIVLLFGACTADGMGTVGAWTSRHERFPRHMAFDPWSKGFFIHSLFGILSHVAVCHMVNCICKTVAFLFASRWRTRAFVCPTLGVGCFQQFHCHAIAWTMLSSAMCPSRMRASRVCLWAWFLFLRGNEKNESTRVKLEHWADILFYPLFHPLSRHMIPLLRIRTGSKLSLTTKYASLKSWIQPVRKNTPHWETNGFGTYSEDMNGGM